MIALAKVWAEARQHHGQSELLDAIVDAKPHVDRHRYHSPVELRDLGLERIHDASALVGQKATAEEAEAYRGFVVTLAERVAAAESLLATRTTRTARRRPRRHGSPARSAGPAPDRRPPRGASPCRTGS